MPNGLWLALARVRSSSSHKKGVFVKKLSWVLGSLVALTALSANVYAVAYNPPAAVPEADPTVLIGIGVAAVGYLVGVARYRKQK